MSHEPSERPGADRSEPPPELRERVLARCRPALEARRSAARRGGRWEWGLAAGAALLLLLNAVQERQTEARIAAIETGHAHAVRMADDPAAIGSLRARATLLAALLRDQGAL